MAPEVLDELPYDGRADLWSVGVIMYEMLVGQVPFSGNNVIHLKRIIETNDALLPYALRQTLTPSCQVRGLHPYHSVWALMSGICDVRDLCCPGFVMLGICARQVGTFHSIP